MTVTFIKIMNLSISNKILFVLNIEKDMNCIKQTVKKLMQYHIYQTKFNELIFYKMCKCANNELIDFLINVFEFNHNKKFLRGGLLSACEFNKNVDAIALFIEKYKKYMNKRVLKNGFSKACRCTANIQIIKYFTEKINLHVLTDIMYENGYESDVSWRQ